MCYKIKTATMCDLDFVLTLNQDSLREVSHLDLKKMKYFLDISSYFKIIQIDNIPIGFLIAIMPNKDYSSENYIWINERYKSFLYIDRIIINPDYRNKGVGFYFYDHLIKSFFGIVNKIICEVNIEPYNEVSIKFHKKYGFKRIGEQETENKTKKVSYMMYTINL